MLRGIILFLSILYGEANVIPDRTCQIIRALNDKLLYERRSMYMGEYFPLDYKLYVTYEEVLRRSNITSLTKQGITVKELRYLWGIVNEGILLKIKAVLRRHHPSLDYVTDLHNIFKELLKEEEVDNEINENILERLRTSEGLGPRKAVFPKALMDNCFKVLYALYEEECGLCNPGQSPKKM
ncbi:interleukin-34 isoform 1-T2 [Discoglossus pictus]